MPYFISNIKSVLLELTLVTAVLFTTAGGCAELGAGGRKTPMSPQGSYASVTPSESPPVLSPSEITVIETRALGGSLADAKTISRYFVIRGVDLREEEYWLTIAAENGDAESRYVLAGILSVQPDVKSRTRARYWFHRIVREGPAEFVSGSRDFLAQMAVMDKNFSEHMPPDSDLSDR